MERGFSPGSLVRARGRDWIVLPARPAPAAIDPGASRRNRIYRRCLPTTIMTWDHLVVLSFGDNANEAWPSPSIDRFRTASRVLPELLMREG
jgi:hypothetical protein